jgi:sarcosine oxidase subunit beta
MPTSTYDVIIIGAGIVGAACAFRLAEQGLRVGLLEAADAPATGSTGKSAAGVRVQFSTEANVRLSLESIQEYRDFPELYGEDVGYRPIGYLLLVPEDDWQPHHAAVEVQRRVGAPVEVFTPEEAQRIVAFDTAGVHSATFGPIDGVVDPHGVTMAYLGMARARGSVLHVATKMLKAERTSGTWRVATNNGAFEAPEVINASGPWARVVGGRAGLTIPVDPYRRMVFVTGPLAREHAYPLTVDLATGLWFRSEGQRLIMGRSNPDEPAGFDDSVDWAWLEPTLEVAIERFPWMEELTLDRRASWAGYYEITPDHSPILGRNPNAGGWLDACGFSGHGVQQAPTVARLMTEELLNGRASLIDIDEFRIGRFAAGAVRGEKHII